LHIFFCTIFFFLPFNVALRYSVYFLYESVKSWGHCPTYELDPKNQTIVFKHIWEPSLDLQMYIKFLHLQISIAKFNSIWPRQISCQTRAYQFIHSLWHTFSIWRFRTVLAFYICCHGFLCMPALFSLLMIYTSNKIKSFHISIILYSLCMFQTKCYHIQFTFHNNYNNIFKCSFLRSSYSLYVLTVSSLSYTILHC